MCRGCGVWIIVGVTKYFEEAGAGRKRMTIWAEEAEVKKYSMFLRRSNMKCVLGVLIMEEEERLG